MYKETYAFYVGQRQCSLETRALRAFTYVEFNLNKIQTVQETSLKPYTIQTHSYVRLYYNIK